ncbi:Insulin receptor [Penaeus vannamei]|uniref:Insulin receptor n=1 Tax=Penaeus vannamei TaxID=6689 RepID=A0A423U5U1_PENVA|nr:Insulin receptor [Penaeus vannamei]
MSWSTLARKFGRSDSISSLSDTSCLSPHPYQIPPHNVSSPNTSETPIDTLPSPDTEPNVNPSSEPLENPIPGHLVNPSPTSLSPGNATTDPAVTDYVLIYRVSHLSTLDTILPRLAVIRGNVLFHEHALVVFGNIHLRELGLSNLTAILKGSVRIEKNWSLCPGTSDRWKGVTSDQVTNIVQDNYEMCIYDPCEGTGNCTLYTSAIYTNCLNVGGCREGEQCHPECVGGCRLPGNATACVACKHYQHGSACVRTCPAQSPRNVHDLRYKCVTASTCEAMSGIVRMMELPESDISAPVCIHCDGNCSRTCKGETITSRNTGRNLRGCRKVNGSLNISVAGGLNITQQLEENLGEIEEVSGYIRVYGSDTLFSLNFLKNLRHIRGEEKMHGLYALYVLENANLQELWDWRQRSDVLHIHSGSLFFHYNPSLCPLLIQKLVVMTSVKNQKYANISNESNGNSLPCFESELPVQAQAGEDVGTIIVRWQHEYHGIDDRFVIGYYVFYRETNENVTLFGGRDACNDNEIWRRDFWEYNRKQNRSVEGSSWFWTVLVAFLCGGMLGICIMELTVWFRRRRRSAGPDTPQYVTHNPNYGELLLGDTLQQIKEKYVISRNTLEIDLNNKLGEGCFGLVYEGALSMASGTELKVAVKALSEQSAYSEVKRFLQEAVIMQ